jgi:hypothetical protein
MVLPAAAAEDVQVVDDARADHRSADKTRDEASGERVRRELGNMRSLFT